MDRIKGTEVIVDLTAIDIGGNKHFVDDGICVKAHFYGSRDKGLRTTVERSNMWGVTGSNDTLRMLVPTKDLDLGVLYVDVEMSVPYTDASGTSKSRKEVLRTQTNVTIVE